MSLGLVEELSRHVTWMDAVVPVAVEFMALEIDAGEVGGGQNDRLPALAADLVGRRVAGMVTAGTPATLAARTATTTIPIVFYIAVDPVQFGLAASLSRPGGNLTGVGALSVDLAAKKLEVLHELLPDAAATEAIGPTLIARSASTWGKSSRASGPPICRCNRP